MSQHPPSIVQPPATTSPGSDISPRTPVPPSEGADYFSSNAGDKSKLGTNSAVTSVGAAKPAEKASSPGGSTTTAASAVASTTTDLAQSSRRSSKNDNDDSDIPTIDSRKSSVASVRWQTTNPALPQGDKRRTDAKRLRNSSPSPVR
ncbi:hypothetical protein GQ53DRAFT_762268 [Thozetella sp. PMI_491]|nr:hypothetical protein GQ53DRAFT_762268 [Thozetella sp. PMI_491]